MISNRHSKNGMPAKLTNADRKKIGQYFDLCYAHFFKMSKEDLGKIDVSKPQTIAGKERKMNGACLRAYNAVLELYKGKS